MVRCSPVFLSVDNCIRRFKISQMFVDACRSKETIFLSLILCLKLPGYVPGNCAARATALQRPTRRLYWNIRPLTPDVLIVCRVPYVLRLWRENKSPTSQPIAGATAQG